MDYFGDLRIVVTAELPGFHNPWKCGRRELFDQALVEACRPIARQRPWQIWRRRATELAESMTAEQVEEITRSVRDRLGPGEVAECARRCAYHQVDWPTVAAVACELVEADGEVLDRDVIDLAAARFRKPERTLFASLFYEPINWSPGSALLTNGQHRACGLVLCGAMRVPVAPGPAALAAERGYRSGS